MKSTPTTVEGHTEDYVRTDPDDIEVACGLVSDSEDNVNRDNGHDVFLIRAPPAASGVFDQPTSFSETREVNSAQDLHQILVELQMQHTVTSPEGTSGSQSSDPDQYRVRSTSTIPSDERNKSASLIDNSQSVTNIFQPAWAGLHQHRPIFQPESVMNTRFHQEFFPSHTTPSSSLWFQPRKYVTNISPMMSQASSKPDFWRGDRNSKTGLTPYHKCTEFVKAETIIAQLRQNPSHKIDHATIFTNVRDVIKWKKSLRNAATFEDPGIPRTDREKQAMVKLLFSAFKSVAHAVSNPGTLKAYYKQHHNNASVEAICWELMENMIARHEGGPVSEVYNGKSRNTNMSFAQRINEAVAAMAEEKSICDNLLRAPKIKEFVDDPVFTKNRTRNNRGLNAKKKVTMDFGKKEMVKLGLLPQKSTGKRSREEVAEVDAEGTDDDYDEDSDVTYACSSEPVPARRFVTPTKPSMRSRVGRVRDHQMETNLLQQQTPSSTAAANSSSPLETAANYFPDYFTHTSAALPYSRVYPHQSTSFSREALVPHGVQFQSSFESPPPMTTLTSEFDPLESPSAYFPTSTSSPDTNDGSTAPTPSLHPHFPITDTGSHPLNYDFMSTGSSSGSGKDCSLHPHPS